MAETMNNKPSLQIRSNGISTPDKSPSPSTKLLINHGKPNFTIQKGSPKVQDNVNPLSPQPNVNNNYNAYKSANNNQSDIVVGTKFNGVFKPANVGNWATKNTTDENEAAKVVLRRTKLADPPTPVEGEDANVPEFIRRQRRIQERLAKEKVLDFENRRSGYFTHVMISPDSPNRTSFAETMASPAVVPALEMPAPALPAKIVEEEAETATVEQAAATVQQAAAKVPEPQVQPKLEVDPTAELVQAVVTSTPLLVAEPLSNGHSAQVESTTNGHVHDDVAAEDVAKAIEEVNKAVAGELDDDKLTEAEPQAINVSAAEVQSVAVTSAPLTTTPTPTPAAVEAQVEIITPVAAAQPAAVVENGQAVVTNGNGHAEPDDGAITISHTNGHTDEQPSIPAPDPSGALGVNFEPKTVVSFAQELGGGENNYPDTVKLLKETAAAPANGELEELSKLKFDIKNDEQNEVQVTSVLRAD